MYYVIKMQKNKGENTEVMYIFLDARGDLEVRILICRVAMTLLGTRGLCDIV